MQGEKGGLGLHVFVACGGGRGGMQGRNAGEAEGIRAARGGALMPVWGKGRGRPGGRKGHRGRCQRGGGAGCEGCRLWVVPRSSHPPQRGGGEGARATDLRVVLRSSHPPQKAVPRPNSRLRRVAGSGGEERKRATLVLRPGGQLGQHTPPAQRGEGRELPGLPGLPKREGATWATRIAAGGR